MHAISEASNNMENSSAGASLAEFSVQADNALPQMIGEIIEEE